MRRQVLALLVLLAAAALLSEAAATAATGAPRRAQSPHSPQVFGTARNAGRWRCSKAAKLTEHQAALCRQGAPDKVLVDNVYTINLAKRTDRWESVVAELRRAQLRTSQFVALDGSLMSSFEYELLTQRNIRQLSKGLVGNLLTHARVWQDIVDKGYRRALILEDDAIFLPEITTLDDLLDELDRVDPQWHFVYTGRLSVMETFLLLKDEGVLQHFPEQRQDVHRTDRIVDPGASEGMWGYILTLEGARTMLRVYSEAGLIFDVDLVLHMPALRSQLRMYAFAPVISAFNESDAFSDDSNSNTGLNLLKRANKLVAAQQYGEARERYLQALALGLPSKEVHWANTNLGFITDLMGGAEADSEGYFLTALGIFDVSESSQADTWGNYCFFLYRHGRMRDAKDACEAGLKIQPSHEKCGANRELVLKALRSGQQGKHLENKNVDL